nr:transposase [Mesorhizobium sp.]
MPHSATVLSAFCAQPRPRRAAREPSRLQDQARNRAGRDRPGSRSRLTLCCVLADAGYGLSAPFRQALTERGLIWAVGIPFKQKVYAAVVAMIFPVAGRGRPRRRHIPDVKSMTAQAMLEKAQ